MVSDAKDAGTHGSQEVRRAPSSARDARALIGIAHARRNSIFLSSFYMMHFGRCASYLDGRDGKTGCQESI